jgi:hypothetical protein
MAEFKVCGPYRVQYEKRPNARVIKKDGFWDVTRDVATLKAKCGIYVFAVKPPGTKLYTPCYVGQAKKSFGQEAFSNDKLFKYNLVLAEYRKGAPYMFFLVHPRTKKNMKQIGELEDFFIMMGFAVNPNIQNDKGAKLPAWSVSGVIRGTIKKPSNTAKHFSSMFAIKSRKGV